MAGSSSTAVLDMKIIKTGCAERTLFFTLFKQFPATERLLFYEREIIDFSGMNQKVFTLKISHYGMDMVDYYWSSSRMACR
jgi:hypothetical protein